jgi:Mg2+/citrate symporter
VFPTTAGWTYAGRMQALAALIPSIGVGFVFYIAIKAMIGADRNERAAIAEMDRAEAARSQQKAVAASADDERSTGASA